jgi:hypothetical protein
VPFGTPCARLEGGAYTDLGITSASTCALGLPSNIHVLDRTYVVNPVMGTVKIYVRFPDLDRASYVPCGEGEDYVYSYHLNMRRSF